MPHPTRIRELARSVTLLGSGLPVRWETLGPAGITPGQIRSAVGAGAVLNLRRGIFLAREQWESLDDSGRLIIAARAATMAYPRSTVSHQTAGSWWGLPNVDAGTTSTGCDLSEPGLVHLTLPGLSRRSDWLTIHDGQVARADQRPLHGLRCTSIARTAVDLARYSSSDSALAIIDAGARRLIEQSSRDGHLRENVRLFEFREEARAELESALASAGFKDGVGRARRAFAIHDPASESVLESLSRLRIIRSRLPMPTCGYPIIGESGRQYWADFAWPDFRVIGEADGALKYNGRADLLAERDRQCDIENAGWIVVRWTWQEIVNNPEIVLARIKRALARAQAR